MRKPAVLIWLVLCAAAALIAARTQYSADLSAFLPDSPTAAQQFLVDQLREGPASQLILIAIEAPDAARRSLLSKALAARLRHDEQFRRVMNGEQKYLAPDQDFVFHNRYLLSAGVTERRFSTDGLQTAIADGIADLASAAGLFGQDLFLRDPTGETLQVLSQISHASSQPRIEGGIWVSRDATRALLMVQTRAAGSDGDAQQRAIATIRRCFSQINVAPAAAARATNLRLTGPGVFAVEARSMIERDAVRLSLCSALVITILLLIVYRSLRFVLFGLLPVATGALAGVAAVALGFGVVHGVTLGFGVTLIGEAVDYSVYLFIQSRDAPDAGPASATWVRQFWPTIRLGMLTSVCGFASLLPSKFPGLAQLGLYSIAGLVAAALVTRYVLTAVAPAHLSLKTADAIGRRCMTVIGRLRHGRRWLLIVPMLTALALFANRERLWNRELSALSPVSAAAMALDGDLRADLGAPDVRTLIVLSGASAQAVLEAAEDAGTALDGLVNSAAIGGYQNPADYLPSLRTQKRRQNALPAALELQARLRAATASLPVRAERLEAFVNDVEAARTRRLIERSDLESTSMAAGVDALLLNKDSRWHAIIPLEAAREGAHANSIDVERVARAIGAGAAPAVERTVLDLKVASDALYSNYLAEAIRLSLGGFAGVVLLLMISLRSIGRVTRVVVPLILAVMAVMAGLAAAGVGLTMLHLIGLLLIVAIGSNYALFFEKSPRNSTHESAAPMLASLLIANLTTVIGFGTLSLSSIPVLNALGSTVAPGAFLALLFSAMLARGR